MLRVGWVRSSSGWGEVSCLICAMWDRGIGVKGLGIENVGFWLVSGDESNDVDVDVENVYS
jgi:hypothetical protein